MRNTVTLDSTDAVNVTSCSTPTFDAIQVGGRICRLYFQNEGPGDLTATISGGPDADHLKTQEALAVAFSTGLIYESVNLGPCEFIRVAFSSVTDDCAVYAAAVY